MKSFPKILVTLAALTAPLFVSAGEPYFGPKEPVLELEPVTDPYGWFVDGFTVGIFPTGANEPTPVDIDGPFSAGGGAMVGYQFNDVLAVSIGGDIAKLDGAWMEHYELNIKGYLPRGMDTSSFMPGLIRLPDFATSQFYLLLGVGAQRFDSQWDTLLKGGIGVEMQITPNFPDALYFLEGYYALTGIATSDSTFDPYIGARTGLRLRF